MNGVRSAANLWRFAQLAARSYSSKSDLKIKWERPVKVQSYKPEKSGDLAPMPEIDLKQYHPHYRNCKELDDADDLVKRLFTLEFAPRTKATLTYISETVRDVRKHPYDVGSPEAKIARWTASIRAMQQVMERYPGRKRLKVRLNELIDKRRKQLKFLRVRDYKKFEWLLEKLNIVYKPPPLEYCRVTRKGSIRKLTTLYCDNLIEDRLNDYKVKLQEEQPSFLQEKIRGLEFIRNEQRECGVPVTVLQEEIDAIRKQLERLLKERELQQQVKEE